MSVFPTCVGMNRGGVESCENYSRVSHMRGDKSLFEKAMVSCYLQNTKLKINNSTTENQKTICR